MSKNKLNVMVTIIGSVLILIIGGLVFNQMQNNHQANERIIEKCFENFEKVEKVMIMKEGFWSPVICEKNNIN